MSNDKVITVFGATGTQGGAVARELLSSGEFGVRAVTRNARSAKAQALADRGAKLVEASLTDGASLRRALDGAYGAFLVTPYWEHRSPARELTEVETFIGAAQSADLHHVLWSTLEDTREAIQPEDPRMPFLEDGYRVPHFDVKGGRADALFAGSGLPVTYLLMSFYWDNLLTQPQRDPDGTLALHLPLEDTPIAGVASEDIGRVARRVLQDPSSTIGATVPVVGEYRTGAEMAAALSVALGERVAYRPPTADQYRNLAFPGAEELGNMFQYYAEFPESYLGRRSLEAAHAFNPHWLTLPDFLAAHRIAITANS
ncbi:NmrA/HSCARG family protein [Dactylosporangium sp. CS-047395]|uniref:NmrA/HSCARG family protein n=1 Tax=Dactylosporangium sp. CS-047395 TaxID=3239936 RepID=UPI003D90B93F